MFYVKATECLALFCSSSCHLIHWMLMGHSSMVCKVLVFSLFYCSWIARFNQNQTVCPRMTGQTVHTRTTERKQGVGILGLIVTFPQPALTFERQVRRGPLASHVSDQWAIVVSIHNTTKQNPPDVHRARASVEMLAPTLMAFSNAGCIPRSSGRSKWRDVFSDGLFKFGVWSLALFLEVWRCFFEKGNGWACACSWHAGCARKVQSARAKHASLLMERRR